MHFGHYLFGVERQELGGSDRIGDEGQIRFWVGGDADEFCHPCGAHFLFVGLHILGSGQMLGSRRQMG